jgi:hypothetical protein
MKFEQGRYGIRVIPENDADKAYLEDTLGLTNNGDYVPLVRVNVLSLHEIAYCVTARPDSLHKPVNDPSKLTAAVNSAGIPIWRQACTKNMRCYLPNGHETTGKDRDGCSFRDLTGDSY